MISVKRAILWVGSPTSLVRVKKTLRTIQVEQFLMSPVCPISPAEAEWDELTPWLAENCRPGLQVDLLYQHHLLEVQNFPKLGRADFDGALKARLKRDFILDEESMMSAVARLDSADQTQAVIAAVSASTQLVLTRAVQAAGLVLGRAAFAGQLALRELAFRHPQGAWTVLPQAALANHLLLARDRHGRVMSATLPALDDLDERARELVILQFGPEAAELPQVDLHADPDQKGRRLLGPALEAPLDFLVPVFIREPSWRVPSKEDLEYPYFFAGSTWSFAAAMLALLIYTGYLGADLWGIASNLGEVNQLESQKKIELASIEQLDTRLKDLSYLIHHVRGVGAETFDNAAWLAFIAGLRDDSAPLLLFQSISIQAANLMLTGVHSSREPILAFFRQLTSNLGEEQARFQNISEDAKGSLKFSVQIRRATSIPPELDDF